VSVFSGIPVFSYPEFRAFGGNPGIACRFYASVRSVLWNTIPPGSPTEEFGDDKIFSFAGNFISDDIVPGENRDMVPGKDRDMVPGKDRDMVVGLQRLHPPDGPSLTRCEGSLLMTRDGTGDSMDEIQFSKSRIPRLLPRSTRLRRALHSAPPDDLSFTRY
jgi:hypothetical protein